MAGLPKKRGRGAAASRPGKGSELPMLAPLRLVQERRAQERVLAERERAAFLTNASALVADSLDTFAALAIVAHNAVPLMADACVVDLVDDDGGLMRAAAVHRDPDVVAVLAQRYA